MKVISILNDISAEVTNSYGERYLVDIDNVKELYRTICCDEHIVFLSEIDYKIIDEIAEKDNENHWRFYYSIFDNLLEENGLDNNYYSLMNRFEVEDLVSLYYKILEKRIDCE